MKNSNEHNFAKIKQTSDIKITNESTEMIKKVSAILKLRKNQTKIDVFLLTKLFSESKEEFKCPLLCKYLRQLEFCEVKQIDFDQFTEIVSMFEFLKHSEKDHCHLYELMANTKNENLSIKKLRALSEETGYQISESELADIIIALDQDKNGIVDFDDFVDVIKCEHRKN